MKIIDLSIQEFNDYAKAHPLGSFHQSSEYAILMTESGYEYDYIGYVDEFNNILAASLILIKKSGLFSKYGYAPKGFLIDYHNTALLEKFTKALKEHYAKKRFTFIKINPEIAVGIIDPNKAFSITYNSNCSISNTLEELGYKKLERSFNFKTILPQFNAILPLKDFNLNKVNRKTRNKINNGFKKALSFEVGTRDSIDILYNFIRNKKTHEKYYYKDIYNVYNQSNAVDVFLVKLNYPKFLYSTKIMYEQEEDRNVKFIEQIKKNPTDININKKMQSDRNLDIYKKSMLEASKGVSLGKTDVYIAGAITIRYKNRVHIYISGYNKLYESFNPNYFLHFNIMEYFKDNFDFIDLNGISGSFSKDNKYYGLNKFKAGFNPKMFEFIGEFDLVINETAYNAAHFKLFK